MMIVIGEDVDECGLLLRNSVEDLGMIMIDD